MSYDPQILTYGIYFLIVTTVVLVVEAVFVNARARYTYRSAVNHRLQEQEEEADPESLLVMLRKERGLDAAGNYRIYPFVWLNRLYLQSGMKADPFAFLGSFLVVGTFLGVATFLATRALLPAAVTTLATGVALPVLVLSLLRSRRLKRFGEQLPEALDIVVRSLRAGHPTRVSLALVATEMSDPIGTEFGIVCDEMTYGLELERAMQNLLERVGLDDLRFVVVSIRVQSTTGGNLAEILGNLADVIRDRFRLRRKVWAISAEGRWSGILLSMAPFLLFGIIALIAPSYYGLVWDRPIVQPALAGMVVWLLIGDYIIYRMVNFDF
jgi:tight adherence protein B